MAPVRVMAPEPGAATKRLLDHEESVSTSATRQRLTKQTAAIHPEIPLHRDRESSLQINDELLSREEAITMRDDGGPNARMDISPVAHSVDRSNMSISSEDQQEQDQLTHDEEATTMVIHKKRKGAGLERLTEGMCGKLNIQIAEGMKHPQQRLHAAKLTSECGLTARKHTPVLPHFKEYKKDKTLMKNYIGKVAANFKMDTNSPSIQLACNDMLQKISKNRRHRINKKFFDPVEASQVSIKSPGPDLSDEEWEALVKLWSTPRHKKQERNGEELSAIDLLKATHNSKKFGFSEEARNAIAAMESMQNEPVPEGQEPKSAIKIVEDVLNKEVKQSTFLMNAGLQSSKKNTKPAAVIAAHVRDLEEKLERSELQTEAMQEEMAAIKKKAEEVEAAQALRDKDYEFLRKKTQEHEDKLAHLMALFGAKQVGI
ncbi:unnamed protein product [Alopecurus aequalis]